MIQKIVTDIATLIVVAKKLTSFKDSCAVAQNLIDTAWANRGNCVGLSANQIGSTATIFVIRGKNSFVPLINPVVLARMGGIKSAYETCLSLPEARTKKRRYKKIKIKYFDMEGEKNIQIFAGWSARVVQHELDHLNGILI